MKGQTAVLKWLMLGVGVILIGALVLVVGAYLYYRSTAGPPADDSASPLVAIGDPGVGTLSPSGQPLEVRTRAVGLESFLSTELWINGVLAGVQAAPSGGGQPFDADFSWIPAQPGTYSLVARATDVQGRVASSLAVQVFVTARELVDAEASGEGSGAGPTGGSGESLAGEGGDSAVLPAAAPIAPPEEPGPGDPIDPAQPWLGTPGQWITSLLAGTPPAAPELVAITDGCGAKLTIHDLSANEEGFVVYRQMLDSPAWIEIATLSSQSQNEWLTYTDAGLPGQRTYYVSAFNSQGEAVSNLALVDVDPADCPASPEQAPILTVKLDQLVLTDAVDQAYCYQSLGGVQWTRWPETGFFTPDEEGLDVQAQFEQMLLTDFDDSPAPDSLEFKLECWGWSADSLTFLGEFSESLDPLHPVDLHVEAAGLSADVLVRVDSSLERIEYFPLGGDPADFPFLPGLDLGLLFPPTVSQMPFIAGAISYDPAVCTSHLEPEAQNVLGSLLLCSPMSGHNIGPGGANPQPYFFWVVLNNTCGAGYNEECLPLSWWASYAAAHDGSLWWRIEAQDPDFGGNYTYGVDHPFRNVWRSDCAGAERLLRVQMVVYIPDLNQAFYGPKSPVVTLPCKSEFTDHVNIEVTFQSLQLSDVDDGDSGSQDVEVYGYFWAQASGQAGRGVHFGQDTSPSNGCVHNETFQNTLNTMGTEGACMKTLQASTHNLPNLPLCATNSQDYWSYWCESQPQANEYLFSNNSRIIQVQNGDSIWLRARLYDHDALSDHDRVCVQSLTTDGKGLLQWAGTTNEVHQLVSHHDNADCKVVVVLNAVSP